MAVGIPAVGLNGAVAWSVRSPVSALSRCSTAASPFIGDNMKTKPDGQLEQDLSKIVYNSNNVLRDMYEYVMADRKRMIDEYKTVYFCDCDNLSDKSSAIDCQHANEVPAICPCPEECYCKAHTCKQMEGREELACKEEFGFELYNQLGITLSLSQLDKLISICAHFAPAQPKGDWVELDEKEVIEECIKRLKTSTPMDYFPKLKRPHAEMMLGTLVGRAICARFATKTVKVPTLENIESIMQEHGCYSFNGAKAIHGLFTRIERC